MSRRKRLCKYCAHSPITIAHLFDWLVHCLARLAERPNGGCHGALGGRVAAFLEALQGRSRGMHNVRLQVRGRSCITLRRWSRIPLCTTSSSSGLKHCAILSQPTRSTNLPTCRNLPCLIEHHASMVRCWWPVESRVAPIMVPSFHASAIMPLPLPCCHGVPCPSPATAHLTHACQLGMPRLQKSMQICQSPEQKASPGISWALICFLSCRV